ncbi:MAG: STT3 domain-containing protein [Candidatus Nanoarchaeia archaeon]|nr:STT3 domain-containing protein [Candidatus Nanoarchaeia archaeon]
MPEEARFNLNKILKFKLPEGWQDKKIWFYIALALLLAILFLGVSIRTTNIPYLKDVTTGNYTLGPDLDPFLYLRVAHEIIEYGHELTPDYMRYLGMAPSYSNFVPSTIAGLYTFFHVFSKDISLEYIAIIFPVIFFGLSIIAFFFLVREIFHKKDKFQKNIIAVLATLLYSVIPAIQHRTVAGIPELESAGLLFFWLSFFLILKASNSDGKIFGKFNKKYLFALLAGISTSLMKYTWGGFMFIFLSIALAVLIAFILGKIKKEESFIYFFWFIPSFLFLLYRGGINAIFDLTASVPSLFVFSVLVINLILNEKVENKIRSIIKTDKISKGIISVALALILGLIIGLIVKPAFILDIIPTLLERLIYPYGRGRTGLTVAENAQPYISDWISSFGNIFFWMFLIGTVALFYETTKNLEKKYKILLNCSFILLLAGFIFSRYSPSSLFNGVSFISQLLYFGSMVIFILLFAYSYIKMPKEDRHKIEFSNIWIISLIFIMILASRGAIRLLVISSPVFVIPVAFFAVSLLGSRFKAKDDLWKFASLILFLVSLFLILSTAVSYEKTTATDSRYTIPTSYDIQWQYAMAWVRGNTPVSSIFVHWWDYGYWVQTIGHRPSVTDGGHSIGYWDHLTGRYLLTTPYPETALSLMKSYNVSYLLIDSTDLGKYPAYSIIGSEESGKDRYASAPIMPLDDAQTQTINDSNLRVYQNVVPADEDIILNTSSGQIFLPSEKAYLIAIIIHTSKDSSSIVLEQPEAVFYYNNQQIRIPMRYAYFNDKLSDFGTGFEGAAYVLPTLAAGSGGNAQINNFGAVIYLSPKVFNSLFAQLYLMNDPFNRYPTVKLAHSEDSELVRNLKSQGFYSDFINYNGFSGPIKIWKVSYPDNILAREEFLRTSGKYAEFDNLTFTK